MGRVDQLFERAGVTDEFVQQADDLVELGPVGSLSLPTVHHQVVQSFGTVHGTRQPVALLHRLDHLQTSSAQA